MSTRVLFGASVVVLGVVVAAGANAQSAIPTSISGATSAAIPAIPEPMIFDMVRPLGARRGELEVNALAKVNLSGPGRHVE
jgi:hypothetical protein